MDAASFSKTYAEARERFLAAARARRLDVESHVLPGLHGVDGETLAMGSTTGSLWASRDAGDSWSAVSRDLPPVYCVRFAS